MTRIIVVLAALALGACGQGDAREDAKAADAKAADAKGVDAKAADAKAADAKGVAAVSVAAIKVIPRKVPIDFQAVGRTEGSREVQVRARVTGILEAQRFTEGEPVKAGAPLFRIERAPFEIELQQARAALAEAIARQELAKQETARLKDLTDRRAISQKEADQTASTERQSAALARLAEARVRQAELNLSYTAVDAPIAGITGRAQQSVGSLVSPNGDSAILTTLTRADPIWVRFALSEAEYARLRATGEKNIEVRLQTADGSEYPLAGKLNFAGSTVDAATGTVQMRAEFPNAQLQLLPGQYVRVRVIAGSHEAIVVPQTAVLQDQAGRFVWIADAAGKAAPRPVRAGSWIGSDWIILEGLSPGDVVIVDNLLRLRPGTPVKVNSKNAG
ncbi:MAG: efflux RND transporter periplasmic adaptor subunit [Burkholderiales bacterium]|nr:efflux RND transporter periplasmic adaptor subunit [Burkholderiales bacterium]